MKSFKEFVISEKAAPVTKAQLDMLEKELDKLFAKIDLDVEFTRHFIDRVNDERNKKQITIEELAILFAKIFKNYQNDLRRAKVDWQAVMTDIGNDINVPFVISWNKRTNELELVAKTTMRKKNFKTSNPRLTVK